MLSLACYREGLNGAQRVMPSCFERTTSQDPNPVQGPLLPSDLHTPMGKEEGGYSARLM